MVVMLSSSCSRAITLTQFQAARSSSLFGGLIPQQPRWHPPPLGETDRWWEWFSSSPNWMGDVIRSYFLRLRLRFATDAFVSLFAPNRAMFCSIRNACRSTLSGNIKLVKNMLFNLWLSLGGCIKAIFFGELKDLGTSMTCHVNTMRRNWWFFHFSTLELICFCSWDDVSESSVLSSHSLNFHRKLFGGKQFINEL